VRLGLASAMCALACLGPRILSDIGGHVGAASSGQAWAATTLAGFTVRSRQTPARRAGIRHRAEAENAKDVLPNSAFMLGAGFNGAELEDLAKRVSQSSGKELWDMTEFVPMKRPSYSADENFKQLPKYERWMDSAQFIDAMKGLRPGTSTEAAAALGLTLSGGSGFIQKERVEEAIGFWRSEGGGFNGGAFNLSLLQARSSVAFSFWFLNVFAPFCTYFFFLRPALCTFFGIDLLPGVPKFWDR